MEIGDRIKSERSRLGFTQPEFAAFGGATKHSQINWESGKALPNAAVLAAWNAKGADVLWIVTGKRGIGIDQTILGMCDAQLRFAYEERRKAAPGVVRISVLVKVYNAAIAKIGPEDDQAPIVKDVVERFIEFVDDPENRDALARALFREHPQADTTANAADPNVTKGRKNVVASGGGRAAGRDFIQNSTIKRGK